MPKAQVTFADIDVTIVIGAGARLIEFSERAGAGILYGCREGECGTCLVQVVSGAENLSEPSVLEDQILKSLLAPEDYRLACQAQVLGGEVVIRPG
jgi:ferredoxin